MWGAGIISSSTIRNITIKQKSTWDTVQHELKYKIQHGCQTDTYPSPVEKKPRAKEPSWSQPAWMLPSQKRWEAAGKPREGQQEGSEAQKTLSVRKTTSTFTTTFQLGNRATVMEQFCFLCHNGKEMLGLNGRGNDSISIRRKKPINSFPIQQRGKALSGGNEECPPLGVFKDRLGRIAAPDEEGRAIYTGIYTG